MTTDEKMETGILANRRISLFHAVLCVFVGGGLSDQCHEMRSAAPVQCPKFTKARDGCVVDRAVAFDICAKTPDCKYVLTTINAEWNSKFPDAVMLGKHPLKNNSEWKSCELPATTLSPKLRKQNMSRPLEEIESLIARGISDEAMYRRLNDFQKNCCDFKDEGILRAFVEECLKETPVGTCRELVNSRRVDVSKVTNMVKLFQFKEQFNGDLSDWDVSSVTAMYGMFDGAKAYNQDMSDWDVFKVTSMDGMFHNAIAFNQDLSKWHVSNVVSMEGMFHNAIAFNQDLSKWDVSKVTSMKTMFYGAYSFNQTLCGEAWFNSKANKHRTWDYSHGSICASPCEKNNGGCDKNRNCITTGGSPTCEDCKTGWVNDGDTQCKDVNECKTNNGGCDHKRKCTNTDGSRTCGNCSSGWVNDGDTQCKEVSTKAPEEFILNYMWLFITLGVIIVAATVCGLFVKIYGVCIGKHQETIPVPRAADAPKYLTIEEVCKLLEGFGLNKCIPIFEKERIDGLKLQNFKPDEVISILVDNGFSEPEARSAWQKLDSYLRPTAGQAIKHVIRAFVVGIDEYVGLRPLKNAVKDATDMAAKLKSAGVIVTLVTNVTIDELKTARDEYLASLNEGDVGLLFYAGHGHMYNNTQRMMAIPKGEKPNFKTDTLMVEVLLNKMSKKKTKANITFLDCCREFKYNETRGGSVEDVAGDVQGSVISYACSPNHKAYDGDDKGHGLYTQCLLRHILTPDIDVHEMLRRVNIDLKAYSKELGLEQVPYLNSSLTTYLSLFSSENTPENN